MTDIAKDIDDMLSAYTSNEKEEEEVEEVEETEIEEEEPREESEDAPEEGEEPEEESVEEEPEPEREEVEEEEEPEEEEEETEEDQLAALRAQIDAQNKLLLEQGITPLAQEKAPETGQESAEVKVPSGTLEILGENESLDDVLNDRESFVKWAQGFAQRIIQSGTQSYLTRLPSVVAPQVRQVMDLNRAVDEFYKDNSDLLPVRSTVGAIGRDLAQKHPDWSLPQLFEEAGNQARKVLRMPAPGAGVKKRKNPSFAKAKGSGRKPKPKVSKLQREIDELL